MTPQPPADLNRDAVASLVVRLRRKEPRFPAQGGGGIGTDASGKATITSYVTDDGLRLVNPDGPEAADLIEALARQATEQVSDDYLDQAIASFDSDPPDNDFQRGYLEALKVVRVELPISQHRQSRDAPGVVRPLADREREQSATPPTPKPEATEHPTRLDEAVVEQIINAVLDNASIGNRCADDAPALRLDRSAAKKAVRAALSTNTEAVIGELVEAGRKLRRAMKDEPYAVCFAEKNEVSRRLARAAHAFDAAIAKLQGRGQ